jgi:hypothetical protein
LSDCRISGRSPAAAPDSCWMLHVLTAAPRWVAGSHSHPPNRRRAAEDGRLGDWGTVFWWTSATGARPAPALRGRAAPRGAPPCTDSAGQARTVTVVHTAGAVSARCHRGRRRTPLGIRPYRPSHRGIRHHACSGVPSRPRRRVPGAQFQRCWARTVRLRLGSPEREREIGRLELIGIDGARRQTEHVPVEPPGSGNIACRDRHEVDAFDIEHHCRTLPHRRAGAVLTFASREQCATRSSLAAPLDDEEQFGDRPTPAAVLTPPAVPCASSSSAGLGAAAPNGR